MFYHKNDGSSTTMYPNMYFWKPLEIMVTKQKLKNLEKMEFLLCLKSWYG